MRALNVFLAIAVSFLLLLLTLEGGLRLIGLGPPERLVQFDPDLGWSKKPNCEVRRKTAEYDVTIRTNEHGLTDDPMPDLAKPEGVLRVLMLGDSFTQGFSVERRDLFVDLLEGWWGSEGRRVEVINAGTEGWDDAQSVAWLQREGAAFEPDLVVLFPYENDLYWNAQDAYLAAEGLRSKPRFDREGRPNHGPITEPPRRSWFADTAVGRLLLPRGPGDEEAAPHRFVPPGAERPIPKELGVLLAAEPDFMPAVRAATAGALRAFRQSCASLGARPLVVPIPSRALVDRGYAEYLTGLLGGDPAAWSPDRPVDLVLEAARAEGIETLDPRPFLRAHAGDDRPLYFHVDWHFTPHGNHVFTQFLHDEIDRLGLLGPDHVATREGTLAAELQKTEGLPGWIPLYGVLWAVLSALYLATYRDEPRWRPPLLVAGLLAVVFGLVLGLQALIRVVPPLVGRALGFAVVIGILGFVAYKLGRRIGTILELFRAFVARGHWYLMPLVVVLLTIGSLLVVAASSPLVAPFIYTLF